MMTSHPLLAMQVHLMRKRITIITLRQQQCQRLRKVTKIVIYKMILVQHHHELMFGDTSLANVEKNFIFFIFKHR